MWPRSGAWLDLTTFQKDRLVKMEPKMHLTECRISRYAKRLIQKVDL